MDYHIIGGGVVGLATALYLRRRGAAVMVIDDNNPCATRAGAGILSPLPPWQSSPVIRRLAARGASAYPDFLALLNDNCGYRKTTMRVLPPHDRAAINRWLQEDNLDNLDNSPDGIIAATATATATESSDDITLNIATVHPRRLLRALRRATTRRIAQVTGIATRNNRATGIILSTGDTLQTKAVIVAAGAWSGKLCPPPAPAIKPMRGEMLLYAPPAKATADAAETTDGITLRQTPNGAFYLLTRQDGSILVGGTVDDAGYNTRPDARNISLLKEFAESINPKLVNKTPRAHWAGLRPGASAPTIARHNTIENLYINSGHHRYGLTMAPAAAQDLLAVINAA